MPRSNPPWVGKTDDSMPGHAVRLRLSEGQGFCCALCRHAFGPKRRAHCDHIIPLADGGENVESNLQMICADCHRAKTSAEATSRARSRRIRANNVLELERSAWRSRPLGSGNNQHTASRPIDHSRKERSPS